MVSHLHLWHNATYANIVDILKQMFSVEYSLKYQLQIVKPESRLALILTLWTNTSHKW